MERKQKERRVEGQRITYLWVLLHLSHQFLRREHKHLVCGAPQWTEQALPQALCGPVAA